MRVFKTSCRDNKTGYEMILSECSYNEACEWLFNEVRKVGREICRTEYNVDTKLHEIWTAEWSDAICNYVPTRHYYYDEERGVLLGE